MKTFKRKGLRGLKFISTLIMLASVFVSPSLVMADSIQKAPMTSTGYVSAAAVNRQGSRAFQVHESGSYNWIGCATIVSTNPAGTRGAIIITSSITFKKGTKKVTLPACTVWDFSIASYKDGGSITLTFNKGCSSSNAATVVNKNGLTKLTGKIHTYTNNQCLDSYWKVDSLGCGFYFKNR